MRIDIPNPTAAPMVWAEGMGSPIEPRSTEGNRKVPLACSQISLAAKSAPISPATSFRRGASTVRAAAKAAQSRPESPR